MTRRTTITDTDARVFTAVGIGLGHAIHVGLVGAAKTACGATCRDADMRGSNALTFAARLGTLSAAGSITCRRCLSSHIDKITEARPVAAAIRSTKTRDTHTETGAHDAPEGLNTMTRNANSIDATGNQTKRDPSDRFLGAARSWARENDLGGALELMGKDRSVEIGKAVIAVRGADKRIERAEASLEAAKAAKIESENVLAATAKVLPDVMKAAQAAAAKITGADTTAKPAAAPAKGKGKADEAPAF